MERVYNFGAGELMIREHCQGRNGSAEVRSSEERLPSEQHLPVSPSYFKRKAPIGYYSSQHNGCHLIYRTCSYTLIFRSRQTSYRSSPPSPAPCLDAQIALSPPHATYHRSLPASKIACIMRTSRYPKSKSNSCLLRHWPIDVGPTKSKCRYSEYGMRISHIHSTSNSW